MKTTGYIILECLNTVESGGNEVQIRVVIKAGKEFKELARNEMEEQTLASFAAAGGSLYIRTEKYLYKIKERSK